jgi:hypothetical protein
VIQRLVNQGSSDSTRLHPIVQALASSLSFIERYRHAPRLSGESMYFFVQMVRMQDPQCYCR